MNTSNWIVIRTKCNMELKVSMKINQLGGQTFLPKYRTFIRHARKVREVLRPLFPRYIFAKINNSNLWYQINNTSGVNNILMNNNTPSYISEQAFNSFVKQFNKNGILELNKNLKSGDLIKVNNSSFQKYKIIFKEYIGKKKAKLLLKILNNEVVITTELNKLSAII